MNNSENEIDVLLKRFQERYRQKKILNLLISFVIIVMGISSVIFIYEYDKEGLLTFRWMTVDGTIFTTIMTICFVAVNLTELIEDTELTMRFAYFARLSSAVAEGLIMTVVLISQLPMFPQHMHILRYDMMCMHILIPILTITSFVFNDSPMPHLGFWDLMKGTSFITVYAIVILTLIQSGVVVKELIPYFFLDLEALGAPMSVAVFLIIYGIGYLLSLGLSILNRKLYWNWFRNLNES